ncbi:MAG: hypothetical protein JSV99_05025, partial [Planctomycetota bacterium]
RPQLSTIPLILLKNPNSTALSPSKAAYPAHAREALPRVLIPLPIFHANKLPQNKPIINTKISKPSAAPPEEGQSKVQVRTSKNPKISTFFNYSIDNNLRALSAAGGIKYFATSAQPPPIVSGPAVRPPFENSINSLTLEAQRRPQTPIWGSERLTSHLKNVKRNQFSNGKNELNPIYNKGLRI